ncbi:MAG: glycine zipper domain-containing protein [Lacunisphaera sp.]|nr:glycine zipper domain-containing protein [Lacunisphaera sp.]
MVRKITIGSLIVIMAASNGCQVAPSKTMSGAGPGAGAGAVVGGLAGSASGNSGQGVLAGAAAGAIIGGIIGLTQEMKERKEQDRLSQERAYQQDLAKKRGEEAKMKAAMEEEMAVAQGFQISDLELNEALKKTESASTRLAKLKEERNAALAKKKTLDDAQEKLLTTEAEIARLEEELARLRGDKVAGTADKAAAPATAPISAPKN